MTSSRRSETRRSREAPGPSSPGTPEVPDALVVGVLVGGHGIGGEVKLRPITEFPDRLPGLSELRIRFPDGSEERRRVVGRRLPQGMLLVRLEGIRDRDEADALREAEVLIEPAEAASLPEG